MSDLESEAKKYIINPKSGRKVKIGSKTYKKLLKEQVLAQKPLPPLTGVEEEKEGEFSSSEPQSLSPSLTMEDKTDAVAEVIDENQSKLDELSGDDLENAIEEMILAKVKRKRAKPKPKPRKYKVKKSPKVFSEE
jgi:hypothetical protein